MWYECVNWFYPWPRFIVLYSGFLSKIILFTWAHIVFCNLMAELYTSRVSGYEWAVAFMSQLRAVWFHCIAVGETVDWPSTDMCLVTWLLSECRLIGARDWQSLVVTITSHQRVHLKSCVHCSWSQQLRRKWLCVCSGHVISNFKPKRFVPEYVKYPP